MRRYIILVILVYVVENIDNNQVFIESFQSVEKTGYPWFQIEFILKSSERDSRRPAQCGFTENKIKL